MTGSRALTTGPEAVRVRHRTSGRLGRIAPDPCPHGQIAILFDGESRAKSVPAGAVEYLDAAGQPRR